MEARPDLAPLLRGGTQRRELNGRPRKQACSCHCETLSLLRLASKEHHLLRQASKGDVMSEKSKNSKQSRGGVARAQRLTSEQRREIALRANRARWEKVADPSRLPEAESDGKLLIGDVEVDVYRLNDGRRVISKRAMATVLGLKSEGGNAFMRTLSRSGIQSSFPQELLERLDNPISFKPLTGDLADGYLAEDLIEVCNAMITSFHNGHLHPSQTFLARQAEIIVRASAKLGIAKLVDEAVGYVSDRKDEYRRLFQEFIRQEARQWEKEFPPKFFDMLYRLYGLKRQNPDSSRHPQFFGHFMRRYIYHPLANSNGAILEYLEERNPVVYVKSGRKHKFFQWLGDEVGIFAFRQHLWQTIGIAEAARNRVQFEVGFYRAFPEAVPMGHQFRMDDID